MQADGVSQANCPETDLSHATDSKFHILVCATGSVAALKLPLLVHQLLQIPEVSRGCFMKMPFISWR